MKFKNVIKEYVRSDYILLVGSKANAPKTFNKDSDFDLYLFCEHKSQVNLERVPKGIIAYLDYEIIIFSEIWNWIKVDISTRRNRFLFSLNNYEILKDKNDKLRYIIDQISSMFSFLIPIPNLENMSVKDFNIRKKGQDVRQLNKVESLVLRSEIVSNIIDIILSRSFYGYFNVKTKFRVLSQFHKGAYDYIINNFTAKRFNTIIDFLDLVNGYELLPEYSIIHFDSELMIKQFISESNGQKTKYITYFSDMRPSLIIINEIKRDYEYKNKVTRKIKIGIPFLTREENTIIIGELVNLISQSFDLHCLFKKLVITLLSEDKFSNKEIVGLVNTFHCSSKLFRAHDLNDWVNGLLQKSYCTKTYANDDILPFMQNTLRELKCLQYFDNRIIAYHITYFFSKVCLIKYQDISSYLTSICILRSNREGS